MAAAIRTPSIARSLGKPPAMPGGTTSPEAAQASQKRRHSRRTPRVTAPAHRRSDHQPSSAPRHTDSNTHRVGHTGTPASRTRATVSSSSGSKEECMSASTPASMATR